MAAHDPRARVRDFFAALGDPDATEDDVLKIGGEILDVIDGSDGPSGAGARAALAALSDGLDEFSEPGRIGATLMVIGALIEHGVDPSPAIERLMELLRHSLERAAHMIRIASATLDQPPADLDEDATRHWAEERLAEELSRAPDWDPEGIHAWGVLERGWPAFIALFSKSPRARTACRDLRPLAIELADHHEAGHWLAVMLAVLHKEPFVAIEPSTGIGVKGTMSGIADNFQLHVLLMDAFGPVGRLRKRRRVSERAAAVARGEGPQQIDETVTGAWNMYTCDALKSNPLHLPRPADAQSSLDSWIWNEGTPADIPTVDGHRVILLGPPSYSRGFGAQRLFHDLPATLVAEHMDRAEVADWLRRIAAATAQP
jgi:hypothetical protein